ncbi:MAG TPA: TonB family protein [Edaphobacter sp.]|nr:TonB family protein [Edaphobacter sp.]
MRDAIEFEMLLDDVLREIANPEPEAGLMQRVMARVEMAAASGACEASSLALFEGELKQEGLFRSIWNGLRELIVPHEAPLLLESRPVAVVDRMVVRRSYRATGWAVVAHVFVIIVIGYAATTRIHLAAPVNLQTTALTDPPQALPRTHAMGGGGGQRGPTPVTKGTPPKFAEEQIVPPKAPPLIEPKIHIEPTLEVQPDVKMASSLPQIGVATSPLVGLSMGDGKGTGLGRGDGPGIGVGSGGNAGDGVKQVGGGVSAPIPVYWFEPEFSEEARKAKFSGNVMVNLWVDDKGIPSHVHVLRAVGMGLDERAVAAVRQYRFKPAMENGRPVTVEMNIEVTFSIF